MKQFIRHVAVLVAFVLGLSACGGGEAEQPASGGAAQPSTAGLSADQLEKGIGPVEQVSLGDVQADLVAHGEEIFNMKCTACHKMDTRYVGPPLGDVLDRRTPEYVMNMVLNPEEMLQKHPEAKAMLAQYMTPMPNQNLTEEEARAVLEYLRTVQAAQTGNGQG